jgi:predicted nucleic acid-binding protein
MESETEPAESAFRLLLGLLEGKLSGVNRPLVALLDRSDSHHLADAALVRIAEREGIRRILTLDHRGFQRLPSGEEGRLHSPVTGVRAWS